jgi:hypothetical protein
MSKVHTVSNDITDDDLHSLIMSGVYWMNGSGFWRLIEITGYDGFNYYQRRGPVEPIDWFRGRKYSKCPPRGVQR